jgi:hypothetical protein
VTGRRANVAFARPVAADNIDLMLSGTCAFCGNQTHFTARTGRVVAELVADRYANYRFEIAATCDACQRFNVAVGDREAARSITFKPNQMLDASRATDEGEAMTITSWSPPSMRPVDVEFIPAGVAGYLKEAHDAYSVGAYRAVLLLVRSVIEATAKDRGVTSGSLVAKINQLQTDGHIRNGTKDMAHALRILGNDMAHGDIEDVPTNEDANDALTVARFVLDDVYVADARRIDMLARRAGGS